MARSFLAAARPQDKNKKARAARLPACGTDFGLQNTVRSAGGRAGKHSPAAQPRMGKTPSDPGFGRGRGASAPGGALISIFILSGAAAAGKPPGGIAAGGNTEA